MFVKIVVIVDKFLYLKKSLIAFMCKIYAKSDTVAVFVMLPIGCVNKMAVKFLAQFLLNCELKNRKSD